VTNFNILKAKRFGRQLSQESAVWTY